MINYLIKNYFQRKANPDILAVYRLIFGLLNVLLVARYFQFFDVVWHHIIFDENRIFLKTWLSIWLIVSVLLLIGAGGRWVGVAQLGLSAFIMVNVYTLGIFEMTHLVSSWVFVLARTDTKFSVNNILLRQRNFLRRLACPYQHSSVMSLFIAGWYFGLIFLYAGLDKLVDPLWLKGNGFYAFCVLPWALPEYLKWIADVKWLVVFCNYAALAIEVGFFFFFPFRKTRFGAVFFFFLLVLGLIYPFNIFFIGLYAANFAFVLFAVTDRYSVPAPDEPSGRPDRNSQLSLVAAAIVLLCLSTAYAKSMYDNFSEHFYQVSIPDRQVSPQFTRAILPQCESLKLCSTTPRPHRTASGEFRGSFKFEGRRQPIGFLNKWFVRCGPVGLFSSMHLMGQYGYRVVITKNNNEIIEPVRYFRPDKSRGDFDRQPFMLNIFQGAMYGFGEASFRLSHYVYPVSIQFFYRFMQYSLSQSGTTDIKHVSLLSAPMKVPYTFEGQVKQDSGDWTEIVRYDAESKSYNYVTIPVRQPFQSREYDMPDYLPRLLWKQMYNQ